MKLREAETNGDLRAEPRAGAAEVRAFIAEARRARTENLGGGELRARARAVAEAIESAAHGILASKTELIPGIQERCGFGEREAARSVEGAMEPLRAAELMALWEEEVGARVDSGELVSSPKLAVLFGGGAIAQPTAQAVAAAMMVSPFTLYRPSAEDPGMAARLMRAVAGADAPRALAARWDRADAALTAEALQAADSLTAFGEDSTLGTIAGQLRPQAVRHLYGSRISFAAMDLTYSPSCETLRSAAAALAEDIAAYDQRGCLSPMAVYLIGGGAEALDEWARTLAEALEARGREFGFARRIPGGAAAAIHSLRAVYVMDPSGARSARSSETLPGWTILTERGDARLRALPGYETLLLSPLPDWAALPEAVRPFSGKLQGMGVGPAGASCPPQILKELENMGISRVCPLGEMQNPALGWRHDGNPFFPVPVADEPR